jgi:hypothetical protein
MVARGEAPASNAVSNRRECLTKEQPMKRNTTATDRLAAKMGYRIKRKRDGRFELVRKKDRPWDSGMPFATMAELEHHLKMIWEHGYTITEACGTPIRTVPPGKDW